MKDPRRFNVRHCFILGALGDAARLARCIHLGYIYILLSLCSYSSLGILHKVAEVKNCRALSISLLMCAWCRSLFACHRISGRGKERARASDRS